MRSILRAARLAPLGLAALLTAGCSAFHAANLPLERWDPAAGYRAPNVMHQRPVGNVLLMLAFSGGGTRAAALSYGVLQELRDTPVQGDGAHARLLDEVDLITSVSGGSFTSAYYGLHGDGIFEDFESRFLRRNVQARLLLGILNPLNWFRFATTFFDRSEVAIRYYDDEIFDHATFADLLAAKGPMLQINSTDIGAGAPFTFIQPQFDLICSDLSGYPVARAVAASSAVPVLFSPLVLENYAGTCGFETPAWLEVGLASRRSNPRRFRDAAIAAGYLDRKDRPYVHLLDGGISDNIGLRAPLEGVRLAGGPLARLQQVGETRIDRVAVIVVNAEVHPPEKFDLAANAPGLAALLGSVTNTQIYGYNFDTIELMRDSVTQWAHALPPARDGGPVHTFMITLGFQEIEDAKEREFFESVPTSFTLPDKTVDRLIEVARRLLRTSPDYQALLQSLQ